MRISDWSSDVCSSALPLTPFINSSMFTPRRESDAFYWKTGERPEYPRPGTELTCEQWRHRAKPKSFEFEIVSPLDKADFVGALQIGSASCRKECVSTCRSWGPPYNSKKNKVNN